MSKSIKNRIDIVYSTNPDFEYQHDEPEVVETLPPNLQDLRVSLDRKQRAGKEVTLVSGFVGIDDDLKALAKILKTKCGVGGTAKDSEIIIQGDFHEKVSNILIELKYKVKKNGR